MILKASQRGGGAQIASYLLTMGENDHVQLHDLRGFASDTLKEAMAETEAISRATKCRQYLFSLSLNPPPKEYVSETDFEEAIERIERKLGLDRQPRAIVFHEKKGRRHAHVVWSRIDAETMKAINLPFFKMRLNEVSKDLFLDHGWNLPDGYKTDGWKNPLNFTLTEWQQAERHGLDPREVKQLFRQAWERSDDRRSFTAALEEHGYTLARGDRRGFVAVGLDGEVHAIARHANIKTKDVDARLGNPKNLPSVDEVKSWNNQRIKSSLRDHLKRGRHEQAQELRALLDAREELLTKQRRERALLKRGQEKRHQQEQAERLARFRHGVRGFIDVVTGRAVTLRRSNEAEAYSCFLRDRRQREHLFAVQIDERADLTERIASLRRKHREDRRILIRNVATVLKLEDRSPVRDATRPPPRKTPQSPQFSL